MDNFSKITRYVSEYSVRLCLIQEGLFRETERIEIF